MPRRDQTPPLSWIRAFREAGRAQSYKGAAQALHVSPSTISHEIRSLEDWVQAPLFVRQGRRMLLTDEGKQLLGFVGPAFDQLEEAFENFAEVDSELRIGIFAFAASEFFVPLLSQLSHDELGCKINISSNNDIGDLNLRDQHRRVDAIVKYASTLPAGYDGELITRVSLAIVGRAGSSHRVVLDSPFDGWRILAQAGVEPPNLQARTLTVDKYVAAMRAVEQGVGFGIAVLPLTASWLLDKRIQLATQEITEISEGYWMLWRKASPKAERLRAMASAMSNALSTQNTALAAHFDAVSV